MKTIENDFASNYNVQKWLLIQKKLSVIETLVSATSFVLLAFVVPIVLGPPLLIAKGISGAIDRIFARNWRRAKLFLKVVTVLFAVVGIFVYYAVYQLILGNRTMFPVVWLAGGVVMVIVMFTVVRKWALDYLESVEEHQILGGI